MSLYANSNVSILIIYGLEMCTCKAALFLEY